MGFYDSLTCLGEAFVCSEGHDLSKEEWQTKDLGETMGRSKIENGQLFIVDGGWGIPLQTPFTGTLEIYTSCRKCPAFVQGGTGNLVSCWVAMEVAVIDNQIISVERTSQSTSEWLLFEPRQEWMAGCLGPMSYVEAEKIHRDYIFRRR